MVPEVKVNDYVLVHVGVAIQTLDEEEAMKTMEYLKELDELNEELGPYPEQSSDEMEQEEGK